LRFTSALSNRYELFAFRLAENVNALFFREDRDQVIVVSEPCDKEPDWAGMPPNHVLVARAAKRAEIVPLFPNNSVAAAPERKRSQRIVGCV